MNPYANLSANSGVSAYELDPGRIVVEFRNGDTYEYNETSAGKAAIETMHRLAKAGRGLSTFIARHDPPYARKR